VDQDEYKALTQMLFPSREDNASNTNEALETAGYMDALVESHLVDMMQPSQDASNPLTIDPDEFVRFFSSINTFKYTGSTIDKVRGAATLLEGNSRDTPTLFEFYCGIKECLSHFLTAKKLHVHQVNCNGIDKEAVVKSFQCLTCQRFFGTEESLATHQHQVHKFQPRPCYELECDKSVIFQTTQELMNHQKSEHDILDPPLPCPLKEEPSCTQKEGIFTKKNAMKQHLTKVHKQTREQIAAFIPSVKSRDLSCPLKCSIPFYAKGFWDVRKHLKNSHQKSDEECLEVVPLNSREMMERARREQNGKTEGGKCPIGGCKNKNHVFPKASSLREHLKKRHQSSDEKIQELIPHQRQQRKKAKLDNATIDEEADE
jgi:hypothetical protein